MHFPKDINKLRAFVQAAADQGRQRMKDEAHLATLAGNPAPKDFGKKLVTDSIKEHTPKPSPPVKKKKKR